MPVVFCMSSRKLSKPLCAWGWHVCLQKWAWAHCTPSPTRALWTPAVQQDHAAFGQGCFSGTSTPASTWEPLMGQAFPSRWLSGSSCVTAWCIVPLLSLKLRSSMQHSDAQSFLSAGMSPSGWSAQCTAAALDWQACGAGCPCFAIL